MYPPNEPHFLLSSNGLVINYEEGGGGAQNGEIVGPKLFVPPF